MIKPMNGSKVVHAEGSSGTSGPGTKYQKLGLPIETPVCRRTPALLQHFRQEKSLLESYIPPAGPSDRDKLFEQTKTPSFALYPWLKELRHGGQQDQRRLYY